jgi:hypothetical protein
MQTSFFAGCVLTCGLGCTAQAPEQDPFSGLGMLGGGGTDPPVTAGPSRAGADPAGVRYAGGETTDFGNGTNDMCGTVETLEPISRESAEALGHDVSSELAWLGEPHHAAATWNPSNCAGLGAFCTDDIEVSVSVTDFLLVHRTYRSPGGLCPSGPTEHLAYRGAAHLQTDDGQIEGTFYVRLMPLGSSSDERDRFVTSAVPDLRNFSGSLPLRLDLDRGHHADAFVSLSLSRDGTTTGFLDPSVRYYDATGGSAAISTNLSWNGGRDFGDDPVPSGSATTLGGYPGSRVPPLVALSVRADAVDPAVDVDVAVSVEGQIVEDTSVPAGTTIELGAHPFGTRISADVSNPNAAGRVRANILQDDCFATTVDCAELGCTAHAEHTARPNLCRQP